MKIWLCVETVKPMVWCVRAGRKWIAAKRVVIEIPMETRQGKHSPHGYLYCEGRVTVEGGTVRIQAE